MTALLPARLVERPWGRDELPPPFKVPSGQTIGEVWFEPPRGFAQLLVKHLFTSEALSIQVHPGGPDGKEECWLITAARPGATIGIGFRHPLSPDAMRAAVLDGSIAELLFWHPVKPGDFIHVPPGTVHAIGGGIELIEVQQNSDRTYRLYDYGRPRELHLDQGVAVALGAPHDPALRSAVSESGNITLVDSANIRLDRIDNTADPALATAYPGLLLVVPLAGMIEVAGEPLGPGQCGIAPTLDALRLGKGAQALIARPATP